MIKLIRSEPHNCWVLLVRTDQEESRQLPNRSVQLWTQEELREVRDTIITSVGLPDNCVRLSDES
ncbi:MAG: hypothetical protein [Caudoviricetes sp.]|nr:MAG: hypothetical protein [Caudoviricetes sp.]